MIMSVFFYSVLAFMLVPAGGQPLADAFRNPTVMILYMVGAGMFLLSFVIPMIMRRSEPPSPASPAGPRSEIVDPRARTIMIIRWAMIEAAAVFGLLAAFLTPDARLALPLGALALVGMFLTFPSDERLLAPG